MGEAPNLPYTFKTHRTLNDTTTRFANGVPEFRDHWLRSDCFVPLGQLWLHVGETADISSMLAFRQLRKHFTFRLHKTILQASDHRQRLDPYEGLEHLRLR